jgi:hypothetical protein
LPPRASGAYNLRVEGRSRETVGRAKATPEMRDLIRRRRKVVRTPLILGLSAITLLTVAAGVFFYLQKEKTPEQTGDIREVASLMLRALDRYYDDHGEYPPYLVGGVSTVHRPGHSIRFHPYDEVDDLAEADIPGSSPNPDPLIAGGYLGSYPMVLFLPEELALPDQEFLIAYDPRGYTRWRCMVSTPGDPLERMWREAVAKMPAGMRAEIASGGSWNRYDQAKLTGETNKEVESFLASRTRILSLGGRTEVNDGESALSYYAGIVGAGGDNMPYFGYQRGEWIGSTREHAWLWYYGSNEWYDLHEGVPTGNELLYEFASEEARETFWFAGSSRHEGTPVEGMDLLNAETGELEPDGIPDGICFLFELKDGEIARIRYDSELITPLAEWIQYAD